MSGVAPGTPSLSNGVGPAVYYGSIAVALALIVAITIGSRLIYRRRMRRFEAARDREERIALERRGEAAGLPTYHESRITNLGLPHYTVTYEPPANAPPQTSYPPAPNASSNFVHSPPVTSPTQENHFHFHFPTLPAALHIRPRRHYDGPMASSSTAGPITSTEPPKYEHSYLDGSPDDVPYLQAAHEGDMAEIARQEAEFEEPFVHPEELRRNEEARRRDEEVERPPSPSEANVAETLPGQGVSSAAPTPTIERSDPLHSIAHPLSSSSYPTALQQSPAKEWEEKSSEKPAASDSSTREDQSSTSQLPEALSRPS